MLTCFYREVQQLRPEVRQSPEIAFAVSIYSALNDKNYIRFFRLVKQTNFLNACILHRYFNQIRYEALKIILRSYCPKQLVTVRSKPSLLSLLPVAVTMVTMLFPHFRCHSTTL